jgi:hypothetical protein
MKRRLGRFRTPTLYRRLGQPPEPQVEAPRDIHHPVLQVTESEADPTRAKARAPEFHATHIGRQTAEQVADFFA